MKAKRNKIAPIVAMLLALALFVVWGLQYDASAQNDTPPQPTPTPSQATNIPDTLPAINAAIADLEAKIKKLSEEADSMISLAEQDKKKQIRAQVKALKVQLRVLQRRQDELTGAVSEQGLEAIRERYRAKLRDLEARNTIKRRETISRYEAMLDRNPSTHVAPDIMWRLANLYFEEAHAEYLNAWDAYEASADMLYTQGDINSVPQEPQHNYSKSIDLLKSIINDFPDYPRKDNALYLLAYCYQEQNDDDNAILVYERLIKETPDSTYVPEAYVRMGEIYFDRDQYDRAIERYQQVLNFEQSKFYDKALYKLGWSYYKMSNYELAVQYFTKVLKFYQARARGPNRQRGSDDLRQESVDYIAISFTESEGAGGARAAVQFMRDIGDEEIGRQVLVKVGQVYDERTDYDLARQAYRAFIEQFPMDPSVPEVWRDIAITYEKQSEYSLAVQEYEKMGQALGPGSQWAQANQGLTEEIERANKLRQTSVLAAATFHHEKAQNTTGEESQAFYRKAVENYELYVTSFPDSDNYYQTVFSLAECYMELRQYPKASENYAKVIEMKKDTELWTEALFNNAKAYELQVELDGGLPNKQALQDRQQAAAEGERKTVEIKPVQISPTIAGWINALKLHVTDLPDSDRSPAMLYKIGEIYYLHRQFEEARNYFDQVFKQYPSNVVVQYAAFYYQDTFQQENDYAGMRTAMQHIPQGAGIQQEKRADVISGTYFKEAYQVMNEATAATPVNLEGVNRAINLYLEGVRNKPNSDQADVALYNVAVAYDKYLKDLVKTNQIYERLASEYPQSKHAQEALLKAAFNYQVLVEFDKAMVAYEKFVRLFPDHAEAGNALFNAAALREEDKQYNAALPLYQQYLGKYAREDAMQVAFTIARLQEQLGDIGGAINSYEAYAKRGMDDAARMSEAYYRWGKIMEGRGDWKEAEKRYLQAVAVFVTVRAQAPTTEARYAAESQFRMAGRLYDQYKTMVFTGNIRQDSNTLKTKAEAFKNLKVQYEQIVTFGNYQWATAALHMIGMINQEFSDSLLGAPVPEGLTPEQGDEYIFKLEEIAFPIKNRALEAFKQNVQKGIDERLINEWIVLSFLQLKKLEAETPEPKFETVTGRDSPAFAMAEMDPNLPTIPVAPTPGAPGTTPAGTPAPAATPPAPGNPQWFPFAGKGVLR